MPGICLYLHEVMHRTCSLRYLEAPCWISRLDVHSALQSTISTIHMQWIDTRIHKKINFHLDAPNHNFETGKTQYQNPFRLRNKTPGLQMLFPQ